VVPAWKEMVLKTAQDVLVCASALGKEVEGLRRLDLAGRGKKKCWWGG